MNVNIFRVARTTLIAGILLATPVLSLRRTSGDNPSNQIRELTTLRGHERYVNAVSFSPDGGMLASGSFDKTVKLWDVNRQTEIATLRGHGNHVYAVAFSPDGRLLASGSGDSTVKLWDIQRLTEVATLKGHRDLVRAVAFSPADQLIVSCGDDRTMRLWDVEQRKKIAVLGGHHDWVRSVTFSPDGRLMACGNADNTVRLWDVGRRIEIAKLKGHTGDVYSVAFSPDGRMIASGSSDGTLKLWDVKQQEEITTLKGHTDAVYAVAFSPDGRLLASGSSDETVKLWGVERRTEIATLKGHGDWVKAVAFSPDGRLIASGSYDGTVKLWDVSELSSQSVVYQNPVSAEPSGGQTMPNEDPEVAEPRRRLSDVDRDIPQGSTMHPNALAVVIGNRDYTCTDVPAVEYAINDASIVKRYVIDLLGYREGNVIYIENATGAELRSVFGSEQYPGRLANLMKEGSSDVFVYYSGHGAPDPNNLQGYFIPVDCCPDEARLNGYPLETFYQNMAKLAPRSLTIVIDACFSGSSNAGMLIGHASPLAIEVANPAILGPGRAVFTSSSGAEISSWYPEMRHGLFTYFFLKGLKGEADRNGDLVLTSGELFDYVSDKTNAVPYLARTLYKGRTQTPTFSGDSTVALVEY